MVPVWIDEFVEEHNQRVYISWKAVLGGIGVGSLIILLGWSIFRVMDFLFEF
jgi:hypothetical protein